MSRSTRKNLNVIDGNRKIRYKRTIQNIVSSHDELELGGMAKIRWVVTNYDDKPISFVPYALGVKWTKEMQQYRNMRSPIQE